MDIQWYPGHMTAAMRMMQEDIKLVDLVMELVDARVPMSSRNPEIDKLGKGKARIILMNKADLADPAATKSWKAWFEEQGYHVLVLNSRTGSGIRAVSDTVASACKEKIERDRRRGIKNRPIRAMVAGIPNVGKSTFINALAGKAAAKTGNKPGVTRGKQWIRLNKQVELLDTPGVLWPKFEDRETGIRLASIGTIREEILNTEELAFHTIERIPEKMIADKYGIDTQGMPYEVLERIALRLGCLLKGGAPDTVKASKMFLDDFRNGRLGPVTLEMPEDYQK